jgi:hypothetical protein
MFSNELFSCFDRLACSLLFFQGCRLDQGNNHAPQAVMETIPSIRSIFQNPSTIRSVVEVELGGNFIAVFRFGWPGLNSVTSSSQERSLLVPR